jgi:hypothetical protein
MCGLPANANRKYLERSDLRICWTLSAGEGQGADWERKKEILMRATPGTNPFPHEEVV